MGAFFARQCEPMDWSPKTVVGDVILSEEDRKVLAMWDLLTGAEEKLQEVANAGQVCACGVSCSRAAEMQPRPLASVDNRYGTYGDVALYRCQYCEKSRRACFAVKSPRTTGEWEVDAGNAASIVGEGMLMSEIAARTEGTHVEGLFQIMHTITMTRPQDDMCTFRLWYEAIDGGCRGSGLSAVNFLRRERSRGGFGSAAEVGHFLIQLAATIAYLYETCGILHGDLSGTNVWVQRLPGGRLRVRLIDCGWCQLTCQGSRTEWMQNVSRWMETHGCQPFVGAKMVEHCLGDLYECRGSYFSESAKVKSAECATGLANMSAYTTGLCCVDKKQQPHCADLLTAAELARFWGHLSESATRQLPGHDSEHCVHGNDFQRCKTLRETLGISQKVSLYAFLFDERVGLNLAFFAKQLCDLGPAATAVTGLRLCTNQTEAKDENIDWSATIQCWRNSHITDKVGSEWITAILQKWVCT